MSSSGSTSRSTRSPRWARSSTSRAKRLSERSAEAAASELQAAGVHAHPVNSVGDLFTDPQLAARGQWRRRVHDVIGEHSYCAPACALSATPGDVTGPAPTLGRDNEAVFRGLLGLCAEEYRACEAAGAFN